MQMSISLNGSEIKVFRDENDKYYTYLTGNIFNLDTNQQETKFYTKRKIKLSEGQEVKNKSKIKVLEGHILPYRFKKKNESGVMTFHNGEMFFITSFEVIEDGILEKQKPFVFKKEKQEKKEPQPKESKEQKQMNSFSFNEYSGVTPF